MTGLYLVLMPEGGIAIPASESVVELEEGVYLVRSDETLSQLYHAVKRRHAPPQLLVAPLSGSPKFKGMAALALKRTRALLQG